MTNQDKVAVVTGASQGIGRGIALRLADDGYKIAILDRQASDETVKMIQDKGNKAWQGQVDISDPDSVAEVFGRMKDEFGPAYALVNAAGIFADEPFLETTAETWDKVMAVNARGPFLAAQQAAMQMKDNGAGRIINILSNASFQGFAYESAYCASKGAALLLTRVLAIELAQYGITVNGVGPGTVNTAMGGNYLERGPIAGHELSRTPLGRFGEPEDIAEAVAFFTTSASWVTGQALYVDGGFTATGLPVLEGM